MDNCRLLPSAFCLLLSAFCLLTLRAAETPPGLEGIPEVVAEVNGKPIHRNELLRELVGSMGTEAMGRLVRRILVEQAAKAQNITVTQEEIEQEFAIDKRDLMNDLIRTMWENNHKTFPIEEIIQARFRMTVEQYKNVVIRNNLLIRRCVAQELKPTEEELRAVFEPNRDYFQPPAKYRARHILISPQDPRDMFRGLAFRSSTSQLAAIKDERQRRLDLYRDAKIDMRDAPALDDLDPAWKRSREKAEKILKDIRAGTITFDQALREHTQDPHDQKWYDPKKKQWNPPWRQMVKPPLAPGDVGWFQKNGPLVQEFYNGAKDLKVGEIGGPVKTEYGYHIIKMEEIQQQPQLSFDECRERVHRTWVSLCVYRLSQKWIADLVDTAKLKTERAMLWPPVQVAAAVLDPEVGVPEANQDPDPVVGTVNDVPLKRSEIWRELIASEGDEALDRLVNLEIVMTMLKNMGLERLEWECANPARRAAQPPKPQPIRVDGGLVDEKLNDERLRWDAEQTAIKDLAAKQPDSAVRQEQSFKEYLFERFGQTERNYRRSIEAGLVLAKAIEDRVPTDDATLQVQFAMTRDAYNEPAWYEISHILIEPNGGMGKADKVALFDAMSIADQVRKSYAANPESWNQLVNDFSMDSAKNKSLNGSLGACYSEDKNADLPEGPVLYREIRAQNLAPQPGLASTPIRTYRGFHVVRVDRVHPERKVDFAEEKVKQRLKRDYLQERAKMYTDVWLRALYENATVEIFLPGVKNHRKDPLPKDNFPLPGK